MAAGSEGVSTERGGPGGDSGESGSGAGNNTRQTSGKVLGKRRARTPQSESILEAQEEEESLGDADTDADWEPEFEPEVSIAASPGSVPNFACLSEPRDDSSQHGSPQPGPSTTRGARGIKHVRSRTSRNQMPGSLVDYESLPNKAPHFVCEWRPLERPYDPPEISTRYLRMPLRLLGSVWEWLYPYSRLRLWHTSTPNQLREAEEGRATQSRLSLITSQMQLDEVITCLVQHGCKNITSDLDLDRCIQYPFIQGGFGAIHQGALRSGQLVAVKCIEVWGIWGAWNHRPKSVKHTAHEMYAWSKCDHPGILRVLGFACVGNHILVLSPWMKEGSIPSYIERYHLCNRFQLCIQVAAAVEYMHSKGIVHGDIKGDNVVMSDRGHAQLADFGCAVLIGYTTLLFTQTRNRNGTLRFMAPELLDGTSGKHTFEADIYALGMTILQIMTGHPPYAEIISDLAVAFEVMMKKTPPVRPDFSHFFENKGAEDKLWALLAKCWARVPGDRPTGAEVKAAIIEIERTALIAVEQH